MGFDSKIEWTDSTFNPVVGCTKVSPGCDHCYAEAYANRYKVTEWGPNGVRKRTSEANWRKPLMWNRQAEAAGERRRVFCASLADVFDSRWPEGVRDDLWELIRKTPFLDWLLLTKRPQAIRRMLPDDWGPAGYPNVWLGITTEDQEHYDKRWPILAAVPAQLRFISYEPGLGPLTLHSVASHNPLDGGEQAHGRAGLPVGPEREAADRRPRQALARGSTGRERHREVPAGPGDEGRRPLPRSGAPSGLAALQGPDPGADPDQPQGRQRQEQPAGEPGAGDGFGEPETRLRHRSPEPVGRAQPPKQADGSAGCRDQKSASQRRIPGFDRPRLRRRVSDDLEDRARPALAWAIVGGESGPHARPFDPEWARSMRDQCRELGVAFFMKQMSGRTPAAAAKLIPEDLQIKEFPR